MAGEPTNTLLTDTTSTTEGGEQTAATTETAVATTEGGEQTAAETNQADVDTSTETTEGEKVEDKDPTGAPDEYADFTAPEGVELNTEIAGDFKALAKELNLPQDKAQAVVDLGVKLMQQAQEVQVEAMQAARAEWVDQVRADKEIGGDKLAPNLALAKRALDSFGSPALAELMDASGLGNHPEVIRAFVKIGKAISDDKLVTGGSNTAATSRKSLYDNSNHAAA